MTYREHILELASQLGISARFAAPTEWRHAYSNFDKGISEGPEPVGDMAEFNYWVNLHELGHMAHKHRGNIMWRLFGPTEETVQTEAEAWDWALSNAIDKPGRQARLAIGSAFGSYVDGLERAQTMSGERVVQLHSPEIDRVSSEADFVAGRELVRKRP